MDANVHQESIQRLDDALQRLTATLASYKTSIDDQDTDGPPTPRSQTSITASEHFRIHGTASGLFHTETDSYTTEHYPQITNDELRRNLNELHDLFSFLPTWPYSLPLYFKIVQCYVSLGYPDLAVGTAYKALLLIDAINDEDDELHKSAFLAVGDYIYKMDLRERVGIVARTSIGSRFNPDHPDCWKYNDGRVDYSLRGDEVIVWVNEFYAFLIYITLAQCLAVLGCARSAYRYCEMALRAGMNADAFEGIKGSIADSVGKYYDDLYAETELEKPENSFEVEEWPDHGMVRRECYPWNTHEPNRYSEGTLKLLNEEMAKVAPKLEVRVTELPALSSDKENTVKQLGVFAKSDVAPGEKVLDEMSLLTANNRLQDALCDACSADLPDVWDSGSATPESSGVVSCPDCSVVFCSQNCLDLAQESYHPALCDMDVEAIAKDVPPAEAADALYTLLLLRSLAMAETQGCHPLDLKEVKYIWGDYHTMPLDEIWEPHDPSKTEDPFPKTLPFNFQYNVVLPFHMLEKMDIDIFKNPQYDVWVFNTLYAKFRGTASARLSGLGGRPIRGPEVSAVHPMWCLANHSCDPNVSWEWGGSIFFQARRQRVEWKKARAGETKRSQAGVKKDEEVFNHYCDVDLPVKERREWASGALGGLCCCSRCVWEAGGEKTPNVSDSGAKKLQLKVTFYD